MKYLLFNDTTWVKLHLFIAKLFKCVTNIESDYYFNFIHHGSWMKNFLIHESCKICIWLWPTKQFRSRNGNKSIFKILIINSKYYFHLIWLIIFVLLLLIMARSNPNECGERLREILTPSFENTLCEDRLQSTSN